MGVNLQGKTVSTNFGLAVVGEYDVPKDKFKVEYIGQDAIGWLTESQFSLVSN